MTDNDDLTPPSFHRDLHAAVSLHQAGDLIEAERLYRKVLKDNPDQVDALNLLGVIAHQNGDFDNAFSLFDQAIAVAPHLALLPFNKANAIRDAGFRDEAIALYTAALELEPEFFDARLNLGVLLHDRGDPQDAIEQFNLLLELSPNHAKGYYNLGKCRQTQGRLQDAQHALSKAIDFDPNDPDAHFALANVLADIGEVDGAIRHVGMAVKLKPDWAQAFTNWGNYLCDLDRQQDALDLYDHAIRLDPPNENALANKAFALLALGRLEEGWRIYQRRALAGISRPENELHTIPVWRNEDLSDKQVIVLGEQGVGDEILFASMIREFAGHTKHCVLAVTPKLVPLLRHAFSDVPNLDFISRTEGALPDSTFDVQTSMIDIGQKCRPTLSSFPKAAPYLKCHDGQRDALQNRYRSLFGHNTRFVGISWASGNPKIGAQKSIPLENWSTILERESVQFFNLQAGPAQDELAQAPAQIRDQVYSDPELDITDDLMAAVNQMAAMDLVITCSNTTAHLAGASGRPTWVLLPMGRARLWYWFKGHNPCPWYPNIKFIQNQSCTGWAATMNTVRLDLGVFLKGMEN